MNHRTCFHVPDVGRWCLKFGARKGNAMRGLVVSTVLLCVGVLGAEAAPLLEVGDMLPPCYPKHVAGPDKNTDECAA